MGDFWRLHEEFLIRNAGNLRGFETGGGPSYWKPGLKQAPLASLLALGYQPLRYRGMAHEALPPGKEAKEVLTRGVKATATTVPNPTVGEP